MHNVSLYFTSSTYSSRPFRPLTYVFMTGTWGCSYLKCESKADRAIDLLHLLYGQFTGLKYHCLIGIMWDIEHYSKLLPRHGHCTWLLTPINRYNTRLDLYPFCLWYCLRKREHLFRFCFLCMFDSYRWGTAYPGVAVPLRTSFFFSLNYVLQKSIL